MTPSHQAKVFSAQCSGLKTENRTLANFPDLRPGDHLLYDIRSPWRDPFGWAVDRIIKIKTWSDVAHIEVVGAIVGGVDGGPQKIFSWASRSDGVNEYPFRRDGLQYVLRPRVWGSTFDWFIRHAQGQAYDWLGLLCFTLAVKRGAPDRMFCSEFARNLDRAAGCPSFADAWPGDKTAPGSFLMSPAFDTIWEANH
jgi:hypothetical protein